MKVYSDYLECMIEEGFSMKLKNGGFRHYTWNEEDLVYWADDVDDRYYMEIPKNAIIDK